MNVLTKWFRSLRSSLGRGEYSLAKRRRQAYGKRYAQRLGFEQLEHRVVPATFSVLNTLNDGAGSLRQAIADANTTANIGGPDRIEFNIGPAFQNPDGSCTIQPLSPLTITDAVIVDGFTQAGATVNTLVQGENAVLKIELDLSQLPPEHSVANAGIQIAADNSTVRGLVLNRSWSDGWGSGIAVLSGLGNRIEGNFIGTDRAGMEIPALSHPNQSIGIRVLQSAAGTLIGGATPAARNIISGNDKGIGEWSSNTIISGNWIGLGAHGLAVGNRGGIEVGRGGPSDGLLIGGTAPGAGNVISGNTSQGIVVFGAEVNMAVNGRIQGNFIGTDATGTLGIGNGDGNYNALDGAGIVIRGANWLIGGNVPSARNIISANLVGVDSGLNTLVIGNYFGTNYTGAHAVVGGVATVWALSGVPQVGGTTPAERNIITASVVYHCGVVSGNWIGLGANGLPVGQGSGVIDCQVVGGTAPGAGNVISGNNIGIWLFGYNFTDPIRVQGNFIGTDPTGAYAIGNGIGILVDSPSNTIGGVTSAARNIISGNGTGILFRFAGAHDNVVQGNYLGTDVTGTLPMGNSAAISIGTSNNLIGGTHVGEGNLLAFNSLGSLEPPGTGGAVIVGGPGNAILGNTMFANHGRGINLRPGHPGNSPLPNDFQDVDDGDGNHLQNNPVLTSATGSLAGTIIAGMLNSLPNTTFRVEFFANTSPDPQGHGEGEHYLDFVNVTTDNNGNTSFSVIVSGVDHSRSYISSTATRLENRGGLLVPTDTSEFSENVVLPPNAVPRANAGGPYVINEGGSLTLDASLSFDLEHDPLTYSWDINGDGVFGDATGVQPSLTWTQLNALGINDGPYFVSNLGVQVSDGINPVVTSAASSLTVSNVAPVVGAITAPLGASPVGTTINASANFTDPGTQDTHTAVWDWGDGSTPAGNVTESNGSGSVTGSHSYTTPGVFTVTLTVTDDDAGSGTSQFQYVVIYDPTAGFVTGGGWLNSPAGAYAADPSLTGKANFGFVSKYLPGNNIPTGNTEFQFKAGDFNFKSTSYDWLVVSGAKARYKGVGTVHGVGGYGFELTAWDGQAPGGGGTDRFRIKIWFGNPSNVIYDNLMGAPDGADPTTALGGGSIQIHK